MLRCLHDSGGSYTHISTECALVDLCLQRVIALQQSGHAVSTDFAGDPEDLSSVAS